MHRNRLIFILGVVSTLTLIALLFVASKLSGSTPRPVSPIQPSRQSLPVNQTDPTSDAPPLFPKIQWISAETGQFVFPTEEGTELLNGTYIESESFRSFPDELFSYYDRELSRRGWTMAEIANGPGSETRIYTKGTSHFILRATRISKINQDYEAILMYSW